MKRLIPLVSAAFILLLAGTAQAVWWVPQPGQSFYWQLQGPLAPRYANYQVIDIDGFDTAASQVAGLKAEGKRTVCYISVGSWENWRPDAGQFPESVKGNNNGWPGERWLDIRSQAVRDIMVQRIQMCAAKGFEALEPDNMDGYTNGTGFPLTAQDQLDYNRFIADTAHLNGLAALQKNDIEQVVELQPSFDAALNEECYRYRECGGYSVYVNAGKPVWQVEYRGRLSSICPAAASGGRTAYRADYGLSATSRWEPC